MMKNLIYTFKNHPNVGNIRGKGLFVGIELVKDRLKKHPFDPELGLATKIKAIAFENGLICYPGQGTVDGIVGDHILLAPPYIFKESHIEELIDKLSLSLDKAISFIEQHVKKSKAFLSFSNLVKEIHFSSGISAKRCTASIFCGLLEYTKLGKIQMKQEKAFARLELAKIQHGNKG